MPNRFRPCWRWENVGTSPLHTCFQYFIFWRTEPLLGNDSVNTFPREPTLATIGRLLLRNGSVNTTEKNRDNRRQCLPWGSPRDYITRSSMGAVSCQKLRDFSWRRVLIQLLSRNGSSSGVVRLKWLRRNGKKVIRLWQEDFVSDLKLQGDDYKSVARIRLVKTENPTACVTMNCKVCKSAIALYYL
jgi:hypothetical protein